MPCKTFSLRRSTQANRISKNSLGGQGGWSVFDEQPWGTSHERQGFVIKKAGRWKRMDTALRYVQVAEDDAEEAQRKAFDIDE